MEFFVPYLLCRPFSLSKILLMGFEDIECLLSGLIHYSSFAVFTQDKLLKIFDIANLGHLISFTHSVVLCHF